MYQLKHQPKIIIFDFDGVIVNSKSSVVNELKIILKQMSYQLGTSNLTDTQLDDIVASSIRHIPDKLEFTLWQKLFFMYLLVKHMPQMYLASNPYPDVFTVLNTLKNQYDLQICSNNISWVVNNWLKKYDALGYFSNIHTALKSEKKGQVIDKILRERSLEEGDILFVTDTLHDYYLVKEYCNVPIVFVTTGFDSREELILMQEQAIVINQLSELPKLLLTI
jgi:phosphoglycolate phosphatase-like HAD superfamily hydrolase